MGADWRAENRYIDRRKVWFEMLVYKQGLDLAIKDLKDNYELYVERYLKWQKNEADPGRRSLYGF